MKKIENPNRAEDSAQDRAFDWEYARYRLAEFKAALRGEQYTRPDVLHEIWAQRAEQFAELPLEEEGGEQIDLVIVRLGQELYGLTAQYVFDIRQVAQLQITRVPRVPEWIAGVVNVRGRVLAAFDLLRFLELAEAGPSSNRTGDWNMPRPKVPRRSRARSRAWNSPTARADEQAALNDAEGAGQPCLLVVETPEMELALLVDDVLTVATLPASQIHISEDIVHNIPQEYVRGLLQFEGIVERLEGALKHKGRGIMLVVLDLRTLLADEHLIVREEFI